MIADFFAAVKAADTARVRELLVSDAALVRARDDEGATALHYAAERECGNVEIAQLFPEPGAASPAQQGDHGA